jgi:ferredoxin-NADP reductase
VWTGLGVVGGWLAAILGLTYWLRDRIGPARWRSLHRATLLVYVLAVAHTLGSGTNAGQGWLQLLLVASAAPILFLVVVRVLPAPQPAAARRAGLRRLRVAEIVAESTTISSLWLESADGTPLPPARPGQFVGVHTADGVRSYSLSGPPGADRWRISVRREPQGAVSRRLHDTTRPGDVLEVGAPAGPFTLADGERPVLLISAGVGATPLLAMLAHLARTCSRREVWWIHTARSPLEHAFAAETADLVERLPDAHHHVHLSAARGRLTAGDIERLGAPTAHADVYVCGPAAFADALAADLATPPERFHSESFGGPAVPAAGPPEVAFARSGKTVAWDERFGSLLELAEAHGVAAPSSCRVGACHACRAGLTAGTVHHAPDAAAPGSSAALLCCSRPVGDVVLDL